MDLAGYRLGAPGCGGACAENRPGFPVPRRTLLAMMTASLLAPPLAARAQETREARIGLLTERALPPPYIDALRHGLTEFGLVEGRSFRIEQRSADGNLDRLPGLAAELIGSGATIIVT